MLNSATTPMNSNFSQLQRIQPGKRHNALPGLMGPGSVNDELLPVGLLLPVTGSRRGS
jgi:hypothetical protein